MKTLNASLFGYGFAYACWHRVTFPHLTTCDLRTGCNGEHFGTLEPPKVRRKGGYWG